MVALNYLHYLHAIRDAEIEEIATLLPEGGRILEIGSGTGRQARALAEKGFVVEALEIAASNYRESREFPVTEYDGRSIPFPDASFDAVYSSNTLEHVVELDELLAEIARVLRPGGIAVHVLPTHAWRFWNLLGSVPRGVRLSLELAPDLWKSGGANSRAFLRTLALMARRLLAPLRFPRHGERGTALSELWLFRPGWWRKRFTDAGYRIESERPMGLFYSGNGLLSKCLTIDRRRSAAGTLGSACHIFVMRPQPRCLE